MIHLLLVVRVCEVAMLLWFTTEANKHAIKAHLLARETAENATRIARDALNVSANQANNLGLIASATLLMSVVIVMCVMLMEESDKCDKAARRTRAIPA